MTMLPLRVLMVMTSHGVLGATGEKTGIWLDEFAAPYFELTDAGVAVDLASPRGGRPPIDPRSDLPHARSDAAKRFEESPSIQALFADTSMLEDVTAADFDGIFYPGGHGPLWDLPENALSIALLESFCAADKPIAAVCHAPVAFKHVRAPSGELLVKGRDVTGFSNSEEAAAGLTDVVPESLEDMLIGEGANYLKGAEDFASFVVVDENLITGQNPASAAQAALKLLDRLHP